METCQKSSGNLKKKKKNFWNSCLTGFSKRFFFFFLVSHHCKHNAGRPINLSEEKETLFKTWVRPVRYFCKLYTNVVLKIHKGKEYTSMKHWSGLCMLNTFYLRSKLIYCLPENILFEVASYDVCKTDVACKESVVFPCPRWPAVPGIRQRLALG